MTHWSGIDLVKRKLEREGRIEAYDAVYSLTDPEGNPHRITRLAAVIHTLRHRDNWPIETVDEPGKLAVYVLRRTAPMTDPTPTLDEPAKRPGPNCPADRGQPDRCPEHCGCECHEPGFVRPPLPRGRVECPKVGCDQLLQNVTPTLSPSVSIGKCPKHGSQPVRT